MLTYGKRKKTSLPSFSSLRDSSATSKPKPNANKKRESLLKPVVNTSVLSNHDDSINEMANMLLDDTTTTSNDSKTRDLPQLPPDDRWAQKTAGEIYDMSQSFLPDEDMMPPIPRRSSKRKSVLPDTFTPPSNADTSQAAAINAKVQAMIDATAALKGGSGRFHEGPFVSTKKRRIQDNKIIVKVRAVINDRLHARSVKKRHDPVRDDHLLDQSLNEMHDDDEIAQYTSAMDIRLNEGDNLKNPKVASLTGHGYISRKPVAEDGRSIRSRRSNYTDPFSERPGSSGITRTPTNIELSFRDDDMSIDRSEEIIPDLPKGSRDSFTMARAMKPKDPRMAYDLEEFDSMLTSSPIGESTPRIRLEPTLDEDGRRTLRHVRADSRSLFDVDDSIRGLPEMEIDSASTEDPSEMDVDFVPAISHNDLNPGVRMTRKISFKERGLFKRYSKKAKKHPSPSKTELEGLEQAMSEIPAFESSQTLGVSGRSKGQEASKVGVQALGPKNPNAKLKDSKLSNRRAGFGLFPSEMSKSGASAPELSRRKGQKSSMTPRPADADPRNPSDENRHSVREASAMDVDELQWNDSMYNIGRG